MLYTIILLRVILKDHNIFEGIDENLYYFIGEDKNYQDVSGCGNTIAANRGLVRKLIIESLKCWSSEFGVDGFRFDLGIALTRKNLSQKILTF